MSQQSETITLGGGCFWCIESAFSSVQGIQSAYCGYAGGDTKNPSYEQVCGKDTGHAEVVQITFDPEQIRFDEILEVFFALHDPTQLNRQGNDVGPQYRSAIFYHTEQQRQQAKAFIEDMTEQQIWSDPIVTEVTEINNYYQAEDYHQDYFANNPQNMYCNMVVGPKLAKFKQTFASKLKPQDHQ